MLECDHWAMSCKVSLDAEYVAINNKKLSIPGSGVLALFITANWLLLIDKKLHQVRGRNGN